MMTTLVKEKIKDENKAQLLEIALKMKEEGISSVFIYDVLIYASESEGICTFMKLWFEENNQAEKDEIIADIQDLINDYKIESKEINHINLNDLEGISGNIRKFKDNLLLIINDTGGLTALAKKTGIPQPSLSRFFKSNSMPQRVTLLKIKAALGINEITLY